MNVTIPDSLKEFVEQQVKSGSYADANAFIADLVRTEAEIRSRIGRGEPLAIDEHFDRRLDALLDEAEQSGEYLEVSSAGFDAMEREAEDLLRKRKSS